ncbi:MAG: Flp family type IVb pilin [Planctomycetota bacterium]
MRFIRNLTCDKEASSAVEYSVLLALIVAACVVAIATIGQSAYDAMWEVVEVLE